MTRPSKSKCIGILTSGGDCPGLNAAIRGVAKAAKGAYGMDVIGILDGFTGLVENRVIHIDEREMSGLLTLGGTILGTSRNKPHKMPMPDGSTRDMTGAAAETYRRLNLDCLICIGGGGTAKNALELKKAGLNVITLPKTIDNDVAMTDMTFGFDSAMYIATEAIDRLHTTASSHHRIMLVDIMGHNAGWLALGASLAGGADVCLIPEIPCKFDSIVQALERRRQKGRRFSLVSVSEGAVYASGKSGAKNKKDEKNDKKNGKKKHQKNHRLDHVVSAELAERLTKATGIEARVTSLGHVQRGGIPTATDRLLATELGIKAAELLADGHYGVMVGLKNGKMVPVKLEDVAGKKKTVPPDHPMIETARLIGLCLGD
ncbi:MAG: 6-phosphofructokinase [Phycisphaerae bacterium]|nr:6-phosphofructokinase [Phycisphaerae bacterium]